MHLRANYRFHRLNVVFDALEVWAQRFTINEGRVVGMHVCKCVGPTAGLRPVPRGDLVERISRVLPENLTAMVEEMLLTNLVSTVGDESMTVLGMERGIPEGSPLSPSLFNV